MIPGPARRGDRFSSVANAASAARAAAYDAVDAAARRVPRRRMRAVGQDRRPGRRRRCAGAGARPAARGAATVVTPGRRLPAALSGACRIPPVDQRATTVSASRIRARRRATARSRSSTSPADGYRLRLVDHPAAFDREGFYGDAAGDYADNAWRFGLFCRAALEALRADGRPVDVLHLHDWHTGPAAIYPRRALRRRPDHRRRGDPHDAPQPRLPRLDAADRARPARAAAGRRRRRGSTAEGSTCCARASSAPSSSTRSRPGSPPRR